MVNIRLHTVVYYTRTSFFQILVHIPFTVLRREDEDSVLTIFIVVQLILTDTRDEVNFVLNANRAKVGG